MAVEKWRSLSNMSDSEGEIGPMPAGAAPAAQDDGVQAFREREQRQREMAERDARQPQKSARPEWMVEMPDTSGGIAASIQASGAPLRARGFHQGGRVQRSGGVGPTGDTEQARRLWTETPEQRRERIMSGGGVDLPNQSTEDESERLARERATKRDSDIREKIKSMVRRVAYAGCIAECEFTGPAPP